jgi:hypothetical protein
MMSDNDWSPEAVMSKVNSLADSPGVTDRAKIEAIKVLMAQWKDQAGLQPKEEGEA